MWRLAFIRRAASVNSRRSVSRPSSASGRAGRCGRRTELRSCRRCRCRDDALVEQEVGDLTFGMAGQLRAIDHCLDGRRFGEHVGAELPRQRVRPEMDGPHQFGSMISKCSMPRPARAAERLRAMRWIVSPSGIRASRA